MGKLLIIGLAIFFVWTMITTPCLTAYKPLISGKFQQGERFYAIEEPHGDDYYFREAWLKYKQKLSPSNYYYFKVRFYENDYQNEDQYDSTTYDLSTNFTYQIFAPLRVKTNLRLRHKAYRVQEEKNYQALTSDLAFTYQVNPNKFICTLGLQREFYPFSDRDNLLGNGGFRWERKFSRGFSVYTQLKFRGQMFYFPDTLADRFRQSISLGFDYQL